MTAATFMEYLTCPSEECLCWIIILLNILSIFYLVFCSFFKPTKTIKVFGWLWAAIQLVSTIYILYIHTCIFTILSTIFSILVLCAVLSVVYSSRIYASRIVAGDVNFVQSQNNKPVAQAKTSNKNAIEDRNEETEKSLGYYVVHGTLDRKFAYVLYDNKKQPIAYSYFKYYKSDTAKERVDLTRDSGSRALVEDRTHTWIKDIRHPKFVLYKNGDNSKYQFKLLENSHDILLVSPQFNTYRECLKRMNICRKACLSDDVYLSVELVENRDFITYRDNDNIIDDEFTVDTIKENEGVNNNESKYLYNDDIDSVILDNNQQYVEHLEPINKAKPASLNSVNNSSNSNSSKETNTTITKETVTTTNESSNDISSLVLLIKEVVKAFNNDSNSQKNQTVTETTTTSTTSTTTENKEVQSESSSINNKEKAVQEVIVKSQNSENLEKQVQEVELNEENISLDSSNDDFDNEFEDDFKDDLDFEDVEEEISNRNNMNANSQTIKTTDGRLVTFNTIKTFPEALKTLSPVDLSYFERIRAKVKSLEGTKEKVLSKYYVARLNKYILIKVRIRASKLIANFEQTNPDFKKIANSNQTTITGSIANVKIINEGNLKTVLEIIDASYVEIMKISAKKAKKRR